MTKLARNVMTPNPACCTPNTPLDEVAKLMAQNDCGEIPVIDSGDRIIGVVTDRDIVCRVVAEGKNPMAYPAETCMSGPVVTVGVDAPLKEVVATMERHQMSWHLPGPLRTCVPNGTAQSWSLPWKLYRGRGKRD